MVHSTLKALVLCGPSGSGKSTLLRRLFDDFPDTFGFSVSHTTRTPRQGEVNGLHYHFTNREDMEAMISNGQFLESAVYSNNMYGTSKRAVDDVVCNGKICVLDIDMQGVKQIKKTDLKAVCIFIKTPSLQVLEKRLRERGTETEDTLQKRLDTARTELEYGEAPGNFNLVIVNDQLDKSYSQLKTYITDMLEKQKLGLDHGESSQ